MNTRIASSRYHSLSIAGHWLTLALLVGVYALIELRGYFPKGSDPRETMKAWHFMLGLTVFDIALIRLVLRHFYRTPAITPPPPAWQNQASLAMHLALYLFLVVMPLLGWLTLSFKGKPIPYFGLHMPALAAPNKMLAEDFEEIHGTIGNIGYYLIGLHTLAALYHHHFMRDNTLLRMLPAHLADKLAARVGQRTS